jgi:hypothetical protein
MQRMHRLGLCVGLTLLIHAIVTSTASAALLRPDDSREYPDITAFANGYQTYTYNPQTQTGVFQVTNVPFLLTSGTTSTGGFVESSIGATSDNIQSQTLTAVLDQNGNLVASPLNSFQVYGTVVIGGQTYTGLLLSGTPTAFGSQTLKPLVDNEDLFDMTLKITGGTLASLYGPDAYVRITAEANSTFDGIFTTDFSSEKVLTNTHPVSLLNSPSPVPEPAALFVLLACGAGLFYRGRRRIAASDLAASH